MVIQKFSFARTPQLYFGAGELRRLEDIFHKSGKRVLLVTGSKSFRTSEYWERLLAQLDRRSIIRFDCAFPGEPSPDQVDAVVAEFGAEMIDWVVAIGGGSVLDAGKAISAMLPLRLSVLDYLEGVGTKSHPGEKVPFIAIPTTAGTGSEATKNAVLSRIGSHGFKKSLRHYNFVSNIAIIDPELMLTCPPQVTAACGMDALTQLLESYISTQATPMTDALALSGLTGIKDSLIAAIGDGANDISIRSEMAYAAFMSGLTLANAGLGIVHGMAAPIGACCEIPHGVFCGTMIGTATELNIKKLNTPPDVNLMTLKKYATVGELLTDRARGDVIEGCYLLIEKLREWTQKLSPPRLAKFGIEESHLDELAAAASIKNNPVQLTKSEIIDLLRKRV